MVYTLKSDYFLLSPRQEIRLLQQQKDRNKSRYIQKSKKIIIRSEIYKLYTSN